MKFKKSEIIRVQSLVIFARGLFNQYRRHWLFSSVLYIKDRLTYRTVFLTVHVRVIARPSVCRLSVTFMRPTQAIENFGNVSMPFGTLAIC